jgi:hypothetical protein
MKTLFLATAVLAGLLVTTAMPALAASANVTFSGGGVSGELLLTYGAATDAKYPDAYEITGITGTFTDTNIGIVNASVISLVPITHDTPESTNLLAPNDFSRFAVASGLSPMNNGFLTFDNLIWPDGSPQTASDYPFHGGFLDIYGLMFNIGGGRVVDLWSNGSFGGPVDYGVAVATSNVALDYVEGGVLASVPEPASLALLGSGVLGLLGWRRRMATG